MYVHIHLSLSIYIYSHTFWSRKSRQDVATSDSAASVEPRRAVDSQTNQRLGILIVLLFICIYAYVYVCMYVCMYVYLSLSLYIHIYIYTYIYIYIYTYMYIHTALSKPRIHSHLLAGVLPQLAGLRDHGHP